MLTALTKDGFILGHRALQRIRLEMGLYRGLASSHDKVEADLQVIQAVRKELGKGAIQGYGKSYLYTHMRQTGLVASRSVSSLLHEPG